MLTRLDHGERLTERARRTLASAAALASAGLAPLIDELVFGSLFGHGRMDLGNVAIFGLWGSVSAAVLGGLAMQRASRGDGPGGIVWWSLLAGLVYLPVLFGPVALASSHGGDLMMMLAMPFIMMVAGAIVSAPAGFGFGLLFLTGLAPIHDELRAPTHETPARAWRAAATLLGVSGCAATFLSLILGGSYCQLIFYVLLPELGIEAPPGTDLAWTRFVVLPTPFFLAAVAALGRSVWLDRRLEQTIEALRRDEHPRWVLAESIDATGLVPLRERDRVQAHAVRERDTKAPYRSRARVVTLLGSPT